MKRTETGKIGEKTAAVFLRKNGYKIIDRNIHKSHNEIDIIASDKEFIVFAEVKARSTDKDLYSKYGRPASAVNYAKQKRIITAAIAYLSEKPTSKQPRFDVIEVFFDKNTGRLLNINHIINAYGA